MNFPSSAAKKKRVRRRVLTAAEMNDRNREFWEIRELRERVASAVDLTTEQREQILLHGPEAIRARIARERQDENDREAGEANRLRRQLLTRSASAKHRQRGDTSRDRVRKAAGKVLKAHPNITRVALAKKISRKLSLSHDRVLTLLKELKLPARSRPRATTKETGRLVTRRPSASANRS